MDTIALLQFLAVDLLVVFTPGADWAYAIRAAPTVAWRGALISGLNPKGLLLFFAVLP